MAREMCEVCGQWCEDDGSDDHAHEMEECEILQGYRRAHGRGYQRED